MGKVFAVLNVPENENLPEIINEVIEAQEIVEVLDDLHSSADTQNLNILCIIALALLLTKWN